MEARNASASGSSRADYSVRFCGHLRDTDNGAASNHRELVARDEYEADLA
jgi:hypothetical protein